MTERVLGVVSARLATRVADIVERLSQGLVFLTTPKDSVPYAVVTTLSILVHVAAIQLLALAVGLDSIDFYESMVIVGVLALGFATPNAPGFFGAVQLALYAGLAVYVPENQIVRQGAVLVFLFYVTFVGLVIGLALLALGWEWLRPSAPRPAAAG